MATYKETDWDQIRNEEVCKKKKISFRISLCKITSGSTLDEEEWYGKLSNKPGRKWNSTAKEMTRNLAESGIQRSGAQTHFPEML